MTSLPPIAIGLFDQSCTEETRLRYPALYRATQRSAFFNHKIFWKWIFLAIFHSAILFWLPMATYGTGVVWKTGATSDYLVLGNTVYSCVMITVCLKAGLELDSWNWLIHLSIWGSIAFWFVFLTVYSYAWLVGNFLAPNMVGMIEMVVSTPMFWFCVILVPFTALIFDIAYKSISITVFTSETDKIRMAEVHHRDPQPFIPDDKPAVRISNIDGRSSKTSGVEEIEMSRGYAFSQEEGGAVSQTEYIRRYDTTSATHRSKSHMPGGT